MIKSLVDVGDELGYSTTKFCTGGIKPGISFQDKSTMFQIYSLALKSSYCLSLNTWKSISGTICTSGYLVSLHCAGGLMNILHTVIENGSTKGTVC